MGYSLMVVTFTIEGSNMYPLNLKVVKVDIKRWRLIHFSFDFCVFQVICMFWLIFFHRVTGLVDLLIFPDPDPKNELIKKVFMFTRFFRITSLQVTKEKHFILTASLDLYPSPLKPTIYSVIVDLCSSTWQKFSLGCYVYV